MVIDMLEMPKFSLHEIMQRLQDIDVGDASGESSPQPDQLRSVDLVIAPNEISMAHGTGVLLSRLLEGRSDFITYRSFNNWGGRQHVRPVADFLLSSGSRSLSRQQITATVARDLSQFRVGYILCVPYFREDVLVGLAAHAATGAPLAVYIMDDNTLFTNGIPRAEMAELISRADTLFAISPEMRTEYQNQFRRKFYVMPPLVADHIIRRETTRAYESTGTDVRAAMIGNVWHQEWFDRFWEVLSQSEVQVTWYTTPETLDYINLPDQCDSRRLTIETRLSTSQIADALSTSAFAIVPSGSLEETGHHLGIAKLSLPSRIPFMIAASGCPILVLGSTETAAARFVSREGVGLSSDYDIASFNRAVSELTLPAKQRSIREAAAALAPIFSASNGYDLLRNSAIGGGSISDRRFEDRFKLAYGEFANYVADRMPHILADFAETVNAFKRLQSMGFTPDYVLDVGASSGVWSNFVSSVYPDARFVLVDPLQSRYPRGSMSSKFEVLEYAVADEISTMDFLVSDDLYNSSVLAISSVGKLLEKITVPVRTVILSTWKRS